MVLGALFSCHGKALLSVVQPAQASSWKRRDEGAKAVISNEDRCPFNSKSSVAWQEQLSSVFEGMEREREGRGNETVPGHPLILFPLRTYRVYIGWSSTAPRVTAPSLAHRAAALRGTSLCLPQKPAGECLRVNHHTCASQHQAWALRVNTKQRHLLNFHEVYRICGISGVRPLGSPCYRLQLSSTTEAQCGGEPQSPSPSLSSVCVSPFSLTLDEHFFFFYQPGLASQDLLLTSFRGQGSVGKK